MSTAVESTAETLRKVTNCCGHDVGCECEDAVESSLRIAALIVDGEERAEKSVWVDRHGDLWTEGDDGLMHSYETSPFSREHVEKKWGPLRLTTAQPGPAKTLTVTQEELTRFLTFRAIPGSGDRQDHLLTTRQANSLAQGIFAQFGTHTARPSDGS